MRMPKRVFAEFFDKEFKAAQSVGSLFYISREDLKQLEVDSKMSRLRESGLKKKGYIDSDFKHNVPSYQGKYQDFELIKRGDLL